MKNYLLLLIFSSLVSNSFAQSYIPFPEGEAVWHVGQKDPSWISADQEQYMYAGDTSMNSFSYHILSYKLEGVDLPSGNLVVITNEIIGFIRQDSLAKKVYYVPKNEMQEYLLYDFNLQSGDTYPLTYGHSYMPQLMVIAKDSIMTGNGFQPEFILLAPGGGIFDTVKIVEGIGSLSGPLTDYGSQCFEYCEWLACFQKDGEMVYSVDVFDTYPFGFCHMVGIHGPETSSNTYEFSPNLVNRGERVNVTNNLGKNINISVYDMRGRLIWNGTVNPLSDCKIETTAIQNGMYLVSMHAEGEAPKNVKMIIQ